MREGGRERKQREIQGERERERRRTRTPTRTYASAPPRLVYVHLCVCIYVCNTFIRCLRRSAGIFVAARRLARAFFPLHLAWPTPFHGSLFRRVLSCLLPSLPPFYLSVYLGLSCSPRRPSDGVYAARGGACVFAHGYAPVDRTAIEREVLDGFRAQ